MSTIICNVLGIMGKTNYSLLLIFTWIFLSQLTFIWELKGYDLGVGA